jgi:thioredoxin-like negative regulator of GroEL
MGKININEDSPLVKLYHINSLPTIMAFVKGNVVDRKSWYLSIE